ncbi:hemolysin III family protein [soil metagenome]
MAMQVLPFLGLRQPVSAVTHGVGFLAACFTTLYFHRSIRGDRRRWLAFLCFGFCLMGAYAASCLYHAALVTGDRLLFFRRLDHTGIYLLIAGTFTPALGIGLGHQRRWRFLVALVWLAATVGICCKWMYAIQPYWVSISFYIGMGWLGFMPLGAFNRTLGLSAVGWALGGGVVYTVGGLADVNGWPNLIEGVFGSHEFMHLCTMGGSACHCVFLTRYVLPNELGPRRILPGSMPEPATLRTRRALTTSYSPEQRPRNAG